MNIFLKKNSKLKTFLLFFILLCLYTFVCAYSYANTLSSDISNSLFRLHVIAASDSIEDQNLKYLVRDAIISYMNELLQSTSTKEEAIEIASSHSNDFKQIAEQVISENGFDYSVNLEIGNFSFPTKTYGDISLPAGYYDALRIEIGKAEGQNWWCVLFPPLCFVDVSSGIVPEESKEVMKESISSEGYSVISETDPGIQFKFKILELFNIGNTQTAKK